MNHATACIIQPFGQKIDVMPLFGHGWGFSGEGHLSGQGLLL